MRLLRQILPLCFLCCARPVFGLGLFEVPLPLLEDQNLPVGIFAESWPRVRQLFLYILQGFDHISHFPIWYVRLIFWGIPADLLILVTQSG